MAMKYDINDIRLCQRRERNYINNEAILISTLSNENEEKKEEYIIIID